MTTQSKVSNPQTDEVVARFEAIKVVIAVAERVLLNEYERNIIISSALVCTTALQAEYKRLTATEPESSGDADAQS